MHTKGNQGGGGGGMRARKTVQAMQAKACLFVCTCAMRTHMCECMHEYVCAHPPTQTNDGEPVSPFSSPARGCAPVSWPWHWCA